MKEEITRFYMIRHGETEWNKVNRLRGRTDISLNELGFKQAEAAGALLAEKPVVAVYTSPLNRAVQTAEKIAKYHNLTPIPNEAFHDFDFGVWSGMERSKLYEDWKEEYRIYKEMPLYFKAPQGESFLDVYQRVLFGMKELNEKHKGQEIVIATHNVTSIITILAVLGLPLSSYWLIETANGSISTFTRSLNGQFMLECFNDTSHMRKLE